jgi:hypothetical protein
MTNNIADFAIIGSTPLAHLLAGLLSSAHGRRVILINQWQPSQTLPRSIDLSVAPITRPESWELLGDGIAEVVKLLGRIAGRGAFSHIDPIFFADDPRAIEALSHMRHMALGFGIAAEPTPPSLLGDGRVGVTIRDALTLNRAACAPHLDAWLKKSGVERPLFERIEIAEDGSAILHADGTNYWARQTILADDEAILELLPRSQWPGILAPHAAATILTAPARLLAAPVMMEIQSGLTLLKQDEGGVAAIGMENMTAFSARVQGLLGQNGPIEQIGQTAFRAITTRDGAPALGRIGGVGADVIAGMGQTGLFMMPALARWLCDASTSAEARWFGARLMTRTDADAPVTEYSACLQGAAQ